MSPTTPAQSSAPALPPGVALYQLAIAHYFSRALALAAKLGVAELLRDGPRPVEALAQATSTDAPSLRRVLRLLASAGIFTESDDGRFSLTPQGDLLREDAAGSMKAMVMLFGGERLQENWKELEYCVRTGRMAIQKNDPNADPFTEMAKDPQAAANFDKAMASFAPQTAAAVAAAYDFSTFGCLMDVGGGNGSLLIGILNANPKLRGIVFDQPHVVERTRAHVAANGLGDRIEAIGGSFFDKVPAGADAILLKHVIHDWNDAQASGILRLCRDALPARGRLLIVEGLYPARIDASLESRGAAANDVNMLVSTGGRQRSEAEFRELFGSAGFALSRIVPTPARVAVIEGVPA